jgi:hypothetical protein
MSAVAMGSYKVGRLNMSASVISSSPGFTPMAQLRSQRCDCINVHMDQLLGLVLGPIQLMLEGDLIGG